MGNSKRPERQHGYKRTKHRCQHWRKEKVKLKKDIQEKQGELWQQILTETFKDKDSWCMLLQRNFKYKFCTEIKDWLAQWRVARWRCFTWSVSSIKFDIPIPHDSLCPIKIGLPSQFEEVLVDTEKNLYFSCKFSVITCHMCCMCCFWRYKKRYSLRHNLLCRYTRTFSEVRKLPVIFQL